MSAIINTIYVFSLSGFIHMRYITKISGYVMTLTTGKKIPVPKARYAQVKREYMLYKGEERIKIAVLTEQNQKIVLQIIRTGKKSMSVSEEKCTIIKISFPQSRR